MSLLWYQRDDLFFITARAWICTESGQRFQGCPNEIRCLAGVADEAHAREGAPKQRRWGKARPYYARVAAVEGLCAVSRAGDKNTVRVELDLGDSGLAYTPGDALGILPANCPQVGSKGLRLHACSFALSHL